MDEVVDSCGTGVSKTWLAKEKDHQLGQSHSKLRDVVVIQDEDTLALWVIVLVDAEGVHSQMD